MRNLYWGLALVIFGILLLLENLDIADMGDIIRTYWPIFLILWGASILTRHDRRPQVEGQAASGPSDHRELLHESHIFDNIHLTIESPGFKGGSVSTIFGNCIIDISRSVIADGDHVLHLSGVFGDTLIRLPHGCATSVNASSVLGNENIFGHRRGGFASDLRVATPGFSTAPNKLSISVSKIFGNITIEEA